MEEIEIPVECPKSTEASLLRIAIDPTDINIGIYILTVKQLLNRIERGGLVVKEEPSCSISYKSQLVESLFLLLPFPSFFINATNDKEWVMIDGSARLNTLKQYVVDQSFSLTDLEFFKDLEGKRFSELIPRWRRRIIESKLQVHIILRGTSKEAAVSLTRRYTRRD